MVPMMGGDHTFDGMITGCGNDGDGYLESEGILVFV